MRFLEMSTSEYSKREQLGYIYGEKCYYRHNENQGIFVLEGAGYAEGV